MNISGKEGPEGTKTPLPTQWNNKDKCSHLVVKGNGLVVEYTGKHLCSFAPFTLYYIMYTPCVRRLSINISCTTLLTNITYIYNYLFPLLTLIVGTGKSDHDAGTVRANYPITPSCGIFYYEIRVLDKGRDG